MGSRTEFTNAATGTGNKFGTYNLISSSAGGIHYGTYNSVSPTNGWAGYFVGKNYISERLSIGETNNASASLNISTNSTGTISHIELEEVGAGDGARIRFTNSTRGRCPIVIHFLPNPMSVMDHPNTVPVQQIQRGIGLEGIDYTNGCRGA